MRTVQLVQLLALVAVATSSLMVLQDLREYNASASMPVSAVMDALPRYPPPTTVLATRFWIPRDARQCNNLVVDLGLLRTVGAPASVRAPRFISMWVWRTDTGVFDSTAVSGSVLLWAGNVSMPLSLERPLASGSWIQTHRFVLPPFATSLAYGSMHWLGVSIGIERAYSYVTGTGNEVRWLVASTAIPSTRLSTSAAYRVIDRFGNAGALKHPALANWTTAGTAEPWLIAPATVGVSGTQRLAAYIVGDCTGTSTDPAVALAALPVPYTNELAATPSMLQNSSSSPSPSSASPLPSASSTAVPTPVPLLSPSPSSASPSTLAPTGTPPSTVVVVVVPTAPSPSADGVSSATPLPLAPAPRDHEVALSTTTMIIIYVMLAVGGLLCIVAALFAMGMYKTYRLGHKRTLRRDAQKEFIQVHDLNTVDADDATNIPLVSLSHEDDAASDDLTAADAADISLSLDGTDDADAIPPPAYYSDAPTPEVRAERLERRNMIEIDIEPATPAPKKGKKTRK